MVSDKKIKTAVVGVGHLGRHHVRWLHQIRNSELVGLYDIDQEKGKKYAEEYSTTAFESLQQLADEAEAVSVVVPTIAHFEVASYLIERGVHCLIEKNIRAVTFIFLSFAIVHISIIKIIVTPIIRDGTNM